MIEFLVIGTQVTLGNMDPFPPCRFHRERHYLSHTNGLKITVIKLLKIEGSEQLPKSD